MGAVEDIGVAIVVDGDAEVDEAHDTETSSFGVILVGEDQLVPS